MKRMTLDQVETAKARAEVAALSLQGDEERAEEFAAMAPEEYAELRGIEIVNENPTPAILALVNPISKRSKTTMPRKSQADRIAELEAELEEKNARIQELEDERLDALAALGVEIIDDEDFEDEEGEEDED